MAIQKKKKAQKRKADQHQLEAICLRVPPEVRELLEETVDGMNSERKPGDQRVTMTGVILMAIAGSFGSRAIAPAVAAARKGAR